MNDNFVLLKNRPIGRNIIVSAVGVVSVVIFFRYQISNGFTFLLSDRYDGIIEVSILEHWYNFYRGKSLWYQTNYFYPVVGTLAYNDGYFIYGLIYSLFRAARIDPFLSGELVSIAVRAIGFPAFYFACRRIIQLDWKWALLGAALFTINGSAFLASNHQQLLSISFAPLLFLLLHRWIRALMEGRNIGVLVWGGASVLLLAAYLMTAFYMAWYCIFFSSAMLIAWFAIGKPQRILRLVALVRQNSANVAFLLGLAVLVNLPFLSLYLPKAIETGMHSYSETLIYSPSLLDVIQFNFLFGHLQEVFNNYFRPGVPIYTERSTGVPPALLFLFTCSVIFIWSRPSSDANDQTIIRRTLVISTLATWAASLHFGSLSAWYLVYNFVPGAKALRVVARYQLFVATPVIAIAMIYLAAQEKRINAFLLAIVCTFLLVEEISFRTNGIALDRPHELARLSNVPSPPTECKAFFISAARPEKYLYSPTEDGIYSHNADAMLIAEIKNLPTVNGVSTFLPPGWNMTNPNDTSYTERVQAYAARYGVRNLCNLNLKTMIWTKSR